ncbi:MAG TPA: arginine--tRNA ligase [Rickettsiales bacterium]|nr:arginine--tRNA ligase [Rickettsiales bacterium]
MNVFFLIKSNILEILKQLQAEDAIPAGVAFDAVDVMPPREAEHGDMATNAAMILAGKAGKKPRELAELLSERIRTLPGVASVEIAGPGFINIRFTPSFWHQVVAAILREGERYGDSTLGGKRKVNVEYVSANPTGPMHVGHGRGAVYGDALASLLAKVGFDVTREYYINDAGAQVDKLAYAAGLRYLQALGETITDEMLAGYYPGDYLVSVGEALKAKFGDSLAVKENGKYVLAKDEKWLPTIRAFAIEAMMELIKGDLAALGIAHNVFTSERGLTEAGRIEETLAMLDAKGLIYRGILEPPKGKTPDDWEPREQTLFKATDFGDDVDRALKKSDGSWTYFAPDTAYHYDKFKRGFHLMVDVLGADHGGYAKRIQAAVKALSGGEAQLTVKLCQMVSLSRGGEQVKMSKRKGTIITAREVVDEVGKGVFRFIMLTRKNDAMLDFDFEKVMEQSKDNPVFYVQYAHARAKSALRLAAEEIGVALAFSESPTNDQLARLTHPAELSLIRMMASFPRLLESAALGYEPHRVAFFLHELAAEFHGLWNMGNSDLTLRFIQKDDIDLTAARLAMVRACAAVIACGLGVLGVEPLEEMR